MLIQSVMPYDRNQVEKKEKRPFKNCFLPCCMGLRSGRKTQRSSSEIEFLDYVFGCTLEGKVRNVDNAEKEMFVSNTQDEE